MRSLKRKKNHPNDILSSAIYMGLVSLVRLASKRTSEKTRKFFSSIENMWRTARDAGDFSTIQSAESNMRGHFLKMVWVSTRRYGNRELKRVYSWFEGTVGPLNALLNYAGARLRDLAMTRYPFPEPETFYIRKYPDGSKKVLTKEENEHLGKDDAVEKYRKAGYQKKGKSPRVLLTHPTLPEMDFVDMIRAHMVELCRQCFIHNVPRSEAHRYLKFLIHKLRPFLDWVYTDGEHGRPYFNRYSDHELREIVLEIRTLYGKRSGREKSVTKTLDEDEFQVTSVKALHKKFENLRDNTDDEKEFEFFSQILDHFDEGRIVQRDIEKLIDQVLTLRSKEGTEWHRILLSDLHHPKSLKQVVFAGDTMLDEPSSVLIVGELPVSRRKGQVDLVIFLRREVPGRIIWTPVMILEIKTKATMEYNLYGFRTKNKSVKDYVPSLYAWKRTTSDDEWRKIFSSAPNKRTLTQLNTYESEVLGEYRQVAPFDLTPPESLWKGVIVLDTDQSPLEVFEAFHTLLDDIVMGLITELLDISKATSYCLDSTDPMMTPRVATILLPSAGPVDLLKDACIPQTLPADDPFKERVSDDRLLTLFVSIPSPISSGNPAAWISRNWHLLHHIQECRESSKDTNVYWIDLMGDYPTEYLRRRRFDLDSLLDEGKISRVKYEDLTRLLDETQFINLSINVEDILAGKDLGFDQLTANLGLALQEESQSERIIVIDGWHEFRTLVPSNRKHLIRSLETRLLDSLPTVSTNVIWIDSGVEHTRMNRHYQRRCISPLAFDSPRRMHLDEIIYNIPTSSRGFGRLLPKSDDERFIVQDVPVSTPPWRTKIHVPRLVDYSKRFRGGQGRAPLVTEEEVHRKELKPMYGRGVTLSSVRSDTSRHRKKQLLELEGYALSLVPSTLRPRGEQTVDSEQESEEPPRPLVAHVVATANTRTLNLSPKTPPPEPHQTKREYVPAGKITRRWFYERFPSEMSDEDDEYVVMRPPTIRITNIGDIDTRRTRALELRRILKTARFLKTKSISTSLLSFIERVESICIESLSGKLDERCLQDALKLVRDTLLEDPERLRVWETVRPIRLGLLELLNSKNREVLEEVLDRSPDVLLLYGNNLFLTVLAVLDTLYESILHSHVIPLWQSVVEWELYQLGFKAQQGTVTAKYDLHALHSNLITRAKTLLTLSLPESVLSTQQSGQIVWLREMDRHSAWIIFQSEKGVLAGLIDGLHGQWLLPKWYQCTSDSQLLKNSAQQALTSMDRSAIVVSEVGDHKILWLQTEGNDGPVWFSSVLEHGTPQRKGQFIPWIKLTETHDEPALNDVVLAPPILPVDIEKHVDDLLREVAALTQDVTHVICEVSINVKEQAYELEFKDKSRETTQDTLLFKDTAELVKTLRHPIRRGTPLRTKKGSLVMWDHRKDIRYSGCELMRGKTRELISVSFLKPLVHRSWFHPDEFLFPKTCSELLSTTMGERVTLRIRSEGIKFSVELRGVSHRSSLKFLESLRLNIVDVALLAECEQLIDIVEKTRHDVEIDAREILALRFSRLSDYPRLMETVSSLDEGEYDWSKGSWIIEVTDARDGSDVVFWVIRSQESGEVWMRKTFTLELDHTHSLEQHITLFKELARQTVPLEFLSGFSETLQSFEKTLRSMGLGEGKPRCRLDLEVREGEHVAVVMKIEPDAAPREIDTFPVEKDNLENLVELMTVDGGPLSYFEVVNLEEFYEGVRMMSSAEKDVERDDSEPDGEAELLRTIREYREEQDKRGLEHALMRLARRRLSQSRTSDTMDAVEEALTLLRECDPHNRLVRSDLSIGLAIKAEVLLREKREIEVARELLREARELIRSLLDTLRSGRTDIIVQETGEWVDRLYKQVDNLNSK